VGNEGYVADEVRRCAGDGGVRSNSSHPCQALCMPSIFIRPSHSSFRREQDRYSSTVDKYCLACYTLARSPVDYRDPAFTPCLKSTYFRLISSSHSSRVVVKRNKIRKRRAGGDFGWSLWCARVNKVARLSDLPFPHFPIFLTTGCTRVSTRFFPPLPIRPSQRVFYPREP